MIVGKVNADRDAVIALTVCGPDGQERTVQATIDTGYNGYLTLAPSLIAQLKLKWRDRGLAVLADGGETFCDIYDATIIWDGHARRIQVDETDGDPLAGMALMEGYKLEVEVRRGGKVTLKPLPRRGR